jgi:hypothetical protein
MAKINDSEKHAEVLKSLKDAGVTNIDTLVASIVSKLPEKARLETESVICHELHWCIIHPKTLK